MTYEKIMATISTLALLALALCSLKTACYPLTYPIDEGDRIYKRGKVVLTSWYYMQRNDCNGKIYGAINIPTKKGVQIKAISSGTVQKIEYDPIIGMTLTVSNENGAIAYSHLKSIAIASGLISEGQNIGVVGRSGRTTGYNLRVQAYDTKGNSKCITNDFGIRFYLQTGEVQGASWQ